MVDSTIVVVMNDHIVRRLYMGSDGYHEKKRTPKTTAGDRWEMVHENWLTGSNEKQWNDPLDLGYALITVSKLWLSNYVFFFNVGWTKDGASASTQNATYI